MKIIGQIYEEDNYEVFIRLFDNRNVLSNRLQKLIVSISEKWVLNPIIVNEKMEIIDGQGRFEALKSLGKPIPYIIAEGADGNDCRRMNKYNTTWKPLDFAISYKRLGKKAYDYLLIANSITKFTIPRILRLVNSGAHSRGHNNDFSMTTFEKGELVFTEDDIETVKAIKLLADEIQEMLQFRVRPNDAFYTAVKIISETKGYNHPHMLRNCGDLRSTYHQMSNLGSQLSEFERIYNHKTPKKQKIYFSDYMRNKGNNVRSYAPSYSPYEDVDVSTIKTRED
jgi:hypothetical protein